MKKMDDMIIVIKTVALILIAIASLMIVSFAWAGLLYLMGYGT